jgi:hypothetical protein
LTRAIGPRLSAVGYQTPAGLALIAAARFGDAAASGAMHERKLSQAANFTGETAAFALLFLDPAF